MKYLRPLMHKSQSSPMALCCFNFLLTYGIPFNRRHGYRVLKIQPGQVETTIPYRKRNFNHIRGIHACAIATLAEFAAGLVLLQSFSPKKYRLIMSKLHIDYHYQAKTPLVAVARMEPERVTRLKHKLETEEKVNQQVITEVYDQNKNAIATVTTYWQLKQWDKVTVKLK